MCTNLTSIIISESITSVGEDVFKYCVNLTRYREAASEPSEWSSSWVCSNKQVIMGHTEE